MRCEVCGRKIRGKPLRAIIEGAKLTVCGECAKHGTAVWEETKPAIAPKPKTATIIPHKPLKTQGIAKTRTTIENTLELVDDYDVKVRQAREKMGLTHEDLGKRINEKVSVLKKIETRKIKPDDKLATKLEHALKIKLRVLASEEKVLKSAVLKTSGREIRIGDIVHLNRDKEKEGEKT